MDVVVGKHIIKAKADVFHIVASFVRDAFAARRAHGETLLCWVGDVSF